jgi:8-oxo-dGTP diphosphatase
MAATIFKKEPTQEFMPPEPGTSPASCIFAVESIAHTLSGVSTPAPEPIPVVCVIIEQGGKVLVAQRPSHKHLPFKWEFPGGKVEPHELPEAALRREILEELGCDLGDMRPLPPSEHQYGTVPIRLIPFASRLAIGSPEPVPHEHIALQWVDPRKLDEVDLAAADVPVARAYLASLRTSSAAGATP